MEASSVSKSTKSRPTDDPDENNNSFTFNEFVEKPEDEVKYMNLEGCVKADDLVKKFKKVQEDRDNRLDSILSELETFEDENTLRCTWINPKYDNNRPRSIHKKEKIEIIDLDNCEQNLNCSICGLSLQTQEAEWHMMKCTANDSWDKESCI